MNYKKMVKKIMCGVLVLFIGIPVAAHEKKHSFEVAYETSHYVYREPHMQYRMKLSGRKHGVSAVYTMRSILSENYDENDSSFASIGFRCMTGNVKYTGWLVYNDGSVEPDSSGGLSDYYLEADIKLGKRYRLSSLWSVDPYLGVGWRELRNDLGPEEEGGYKRTQTYVYIPLGTHLNWKMSERVSLAFNGQFDWMVHGNNNSGLVGGYQAYNRDSVSFRQGQGYGLRVSAKATMDMGKIGLFVEPFWRYWHIQNSEKQYYDLHYIDDEGEEQIIENYGYYQEPFNTTQEYGVRVGITF